MTDSGASDMHGVAGADYAYPHGHLGSLDEHQKEALEQFKKLLEEEDLYKRGPPASHDDPILLRYLRARRWVPNEALTQFRDSVKWREANDIDVLYSTIEVDSYEQSRRMYPQWTGRRDKRGIPLYLFHIKHLDSKAVADYERAGASKTFSKAKTDGSTPAGLLRLFTLYENLTHFVMPFCTQLQDREFASTPITMTTNIVDISGVGLKQFWNLKSHMQAASQLATAHYPETLDRIFIIGAPYFFSTVWGWIKRWFDPITVSKIFILAPHEVEPTLRQFIEPRNIPKQYGGELDFAWGDMPTVDPAWTGVVEWADGHASFPTGPHVWRDVEGSGGTRMECVGLGQKDGKEREERICVVVKGYSAASETGASSVVEGSASASAETAASSVGSKEEDGAAKGLSDGVGKLAIDDKAADKKKEEGVEDEKRVERPVSPALPTTVA